jgi:hypothetical protein
MRRIARAAVIAAGLGLIAASTLSTAWAQQPGRIRGQIEKVDGPMLTVDGSVLAKTLYVGRGLTPAM